MMQKKYYMGQKILKVRGQKKKDHKLFHNFINN